MEWSKYSCVHQGAYAHAKNSQKLTFEPSACSLPDVTMNSQVFQSGRRIVFAGDSLIRQVFIAFACLLFPHVQSYNAGWQKCGGRAWACHNTLNCIKCGAHSGFGKGNVTLVNGSSLHYDRSIDWSIAPRSTDVYVVETGVHGNDPHTMAQHRLREFVTRLLSANSTVIWLITPQESFPSASGNGLYNATFLAGRAKTMCAKSSRAVRSAGEWQALHEEHRILSKLAGVIELDGLNHQGDAKIGGGVGAHGDCQHYCMPGVPDFLARAVFAMLLHS